MEEDTWLTGPSWCQTMGCNCHPWEILTSRQVSLCTVEYNYGWYLVGPGEEDEHPYQHGLHGFPGLLAGEGAQLWRRNEPGPHFRLKVVIFETLVPLINLAPNILKEQASDIGLIHREVCGIHNCPMATILFTWPQQSFTMSINGTISIWRCTQRLHVLQPTKPSNLGYD